MAGEGCGGVKWFIRAESGPSLRMRNLVSAYEEADVRQHATFSSVANGSKALGNPPIYGAV
jgi:hypothetical protein